MFVSQKKQNFGRNDNFLTILEIEDFHLGNFFCVKHSKNILLTRFQPMAKHHFGHKIGIAVEMWFSSRNRPKKYVLKR